MQNQLLPLLEDLKQNYSTKKSSIIIQILYEEMTSFTDLYENSIYSKSCFNGQDEKFYDELAILFVEENKTDLINLQQELFKIDNIHYPLLKVVDMYFWQEGYNKEIQ